MIEEQEREIRLSIAEPELVQILEALSESNLTALAVKVNKAWLADGLEEEAVRAAIIL
jgi:hypothetical protein